MGRKQFSHPMKIGEISKISHPELEKVKSHIVADWKSGRKLVQVNQRVLLRFQPFFTFKKNVISSYFKIKSCFKTEIFYSKNVKIKCFKNFETFLQNRWVEKFIKTDPLLWTLSVVTNQHFLTKNKPNQTLVWKFPNRSIGRAKLPLSGCCTVYIIYRCLRMSPWGNGLEGKG